MDSDSFSWAEGEHGSLPCGFNDLDDDLADALESLGFFLLDFLGRSESCDGTVSAAESMDCRVVVGLLASSTSALEDLLGGRCFPDLALVGDSASPDDNEWLWHLDDFGNSDDSVAGELL